MKAKLVHESLNTTREIIEEIIEQNVRVKSTKVKLLTALDKIYSFDEEAPNMDRKELTRINNDFSALIQNLTGNKEYKDNYDSDLKKLIAIKGYPDIYTAYSIKKDEIYSVLQFSIIYDLLDAIRKFKRIQTIKLTPEEQKFIDKWYTNLKDWTSLGDKLEKIRKVVAPTGEEKRGKAIEQIKGKINPEIKNAIDEIAENFRVTIEKNEYQWYLRKFAEFYKEFPEGANYTQYNDKKYRSIFTELGSFIYIVIHPFRLFSIIPNAEEKAAKLANKKSYIIIASWQGKMYNKLGGFMSELNKKFTTDVVGRGPRENDIYFKFENGAKFTLRNKIVDKISHLGTYFYTYPTTFHSAFLANGDKIANPNEFTVKDAFNKNN